MRYPSELKAREVRMYHEVDLLMRLNCEAPAGQTAITALPNLVHSVPGKYLPIEHLMRDQREAGQFTKAEVVPVDGRRSRSSPDNQWCNGQEILVNQPFSEQAGCQTSPASTAEAADPCIGNLLEGIPPIDTSEILCRANNHVLEELGDSRLWGPCRDEPAGVWLLEEGEIAIEFAADTGDDVRTDVLGT